MNHFPGPAALMPELYMKGAQLHFFLELDGSVTADEHSEEEQEFKSIVVGTINSGV